MPVGLSTYNGKKRKRQSCRKMILVAESRDEENFKGVFEDDARWIGDGCNLSISLRNLPVNLTVQS
jgi:hypothetical protein